MSLPRLADFAEAEPSADFAGPFVSQATFHGGMAAIELERDEIERILPNELELATPADQAHPIVVLFGDQTEGTMLAGGVPVPLGFRYHETCSAVPFVRHRGRLCTFVFRMYCGRYGPTLFGNANYGLAKQLANLRWSGPVLSIDDDRARPIESYRLIARTEEASDTLSRIIEAMSLPIVGRKRDGRYSECRFGWGLSHADSQPVSVELDVHQAHDGLEARRYRSDDAVEIRRAIWRISWPLDKLNRFRPDSASTWSDSR